MKSNRFALLDGVLLLIGVAILTLVFRPVVQETRELDQVELTKSGEVLLNGEEVGLFNEDVVLFAETTDVGTKLHRVFRTEAEAGSVSVKVAGTVPVGWNNRLVAVVYGLVDFKLCSWKTLSYQVDQELPTLVEIGLLRTARQLTIELLNEEEKREGEDGPFLYFSDAHVKLPSGEVNPDLGLYSVVIKGASMELLDARAKVRRLLPKAQVGFEQRLEARPQEWSGSMESSNKDESDHIQLSANGLVSINGKMVIQFEADHQSWRDTRTYARPLLRYFQNHARKRSAWINVNAEANTGWHKRLLNVIVEMGDSRGQALWEEFIYQVNQEAPVTISPRLFFTTRSFHVRVSGNDRTRLSLNSEHVLWHSGGKNPDHGMSASIGTEGITTVLETRQWLRQVLGPHAQLGFSQPVIIVEPTTPETITAPVE
jgi:hypothetical protein